MTPSWDGIERRETAMLAEQLKPKNVVDVPIVGVLVGFAAVLLLQAAAVWSHGEILQNQHQILEEQDRFACYVVRTSQGAVPADVLTECGFLNVGVARR